MPSQSYLPSPWRTSHHQTARGWMVGKKRAQFSALETLSLSWSNSRLLVPLSVAWLYILPGFHSSLCERGPNFDFCSWMGNTFMKHSLVEINKETFGDLKRSLFLVCLFEIGNNHQKSQIWINGNVIYVWCGKQPPHFFLYLHDIVLIKYMCSSALFNRNSFMCPNKKGLRGKEVISFTNLSSLLISLKQINDFGN